MPRVAKGPRPGQDYSVIGAARFLPSYDHFGLFDASRYTPMETCPLLLVVDDDEDVRATIAMMLELEGYTIYTAVNGKAALEVLDTLPIGTPCVILLDQRMPIMTGEEFLKFLRTSERRETPVILVSAAPDVDHIKLANAILKKPINMDLLLDHVRKFCRPDRAA